MFSFVEDVVLDPFLGSGTTSLAAKRLRRNSIGYEINETFVPTIIQKIGGGQQGLFHNCKIEVVKADRIEQDYAHRIRNLPYVFKDPVRFEKKIDPRRINFGSKIDGSETGREIYFSLSEILSPERLKLSNGLTVRLIGIKENPQKRQEA